MAPKNPQDVAAKWAQNLAGSTQNISAGVARVTEAPGVSAARQRALWLQRTQAAQEKWARNVARVGLADWQQAMNEKGIARIASGAQAAVPKMQDFMAEFLPHVEAGARQVRAMPKGGVEEGIARAAAMIRHNANFKRSGGRG